MYDIYQCLVTKFLQVNHPMARLHDHKRSGPSTPTLSLNFSSSLKLPHMSIYFVHKIIYCLNDYPRSHIEFNLDSLAISHSYQNPSNPRILPSEVHVLWHRLSPIPHARAAQNASRRRLGLQNLGNILSKAVSASLIRPPNFFLFNAWDLFIFLWKGPNSED